MTSVLLLALGLIPSMLFAYLILATFYGANRAYFAISWVPVAYYLIIWIFQSLLHFQHLTDDWWSELAVTIGWASLVQAGLGLGLVARSLVNHKGIFGLIAATSASASPFLLRFIR